MTNEQQTNTNTHSYVRRDDVAVAFLRHSGFDLMFARNINTQLNKNNNNRNNIRSTRFECSVVLSETKRYDIDRFICTRYV